MNQICENMTLPLVTFKTRVRVENDEENPFVWKDLTTNDYFKGKKCILFSLPGAFTPTCSSSHLPGYENLYDKFKKLGVDELQDPDDDGKPEVKITNKPLSYTDIKKFKGTV